jgi:hypothetical protein
MTGRRDWRGGKRGKVPQNSNFTLGLWMLHPPKGVSMAARNFSGKMVLFTTVGRLTEP